MKIRKKAPDIDLSTVLGGIVTGRTRDLWQHLSGRAKHRFQLGARGCQTRSGLWLLNVDGNRFYTIAIESGGELFQVGQVHTATPAIVAILDQMTAFESDERIAKAKREQRLAEIGQEAAEIEMRRDLWGQDVHRPKGGDGIKIRKGGVGMVEELQAEPMPSRAVNSMDALLTVNGEHHAEVQRET